MSTHSCPDQLCQNITWRLLTFATKNCSKIQVSNPCLGSKLFFFFSFLNSPYKTEYWNLNSFLISHFTTWISIKNRNFKIFHAILCYYLVRILQNGLRFQYLLCMKNLKNYEKKGKYM